MILSKPGKPGFTQVGVEVAKRLCEEVGRTALKSIETRKDEQPLRAVRHVRSQRNVVGSSAELQEMLTELECNRIRKLRMRLKTPVVS